jgi:hypothetical protein
MTGEKLWITPKYRGSVRVEIAFMFDALFGVLVGAASESQ